MNILDENIPKPQRELLEGWRIKVRQIGVDVGRKGMLDEEIIPLLQTLRRPTFFTRDDDFHERGLCHAKYCLVYLAVEKTEIASFVRRFLRHPDFKTQVRQMGKVLCVSHTGIGVWQRHQLRQQQVGWK
jgi:hypothetical protein